MKFSYDIFKSTTSQYTTKMHNLQYKHSTYHYQELGVLLEIFTTVAFEPLLHICCCPQVTGFWSG